jgi:DNA uptake protein ComE-like DNA-binding protein
MALEPHSIHCKMKRRFQLAGASILLACLAGCSHRETREVVAKATEHAKPGIQWSARKAGQGARWLCEEAVAAAEGFFEGWEHKATEVDLNSASLRQLEELPGITHEDAQEIVRRRPYQVPDELVSKGVVTRSVYRKIRDQVTTKRSSG